MKIARLLAIALSACLVMTLSPSVSVGAGKVTLETDRKRYERGEMVVVTLTNGSNRAITFEDPWSVVDKDGNSRGRRTWYEEERTVAPGDTRVWEYPQDFNICGSDGACTKIGGTIDSGRYEAVVDTSVGTLTAPFLTGQTFVLGFRCGSTDCGHDDFVVFVAREKARAAIKDELDKPQEERSLIVSGIVRGPARYNKAWRFSMGPRSIVTGEVFIEVCDGSPRYVQRNHDEWRGQRWCPWSSYVKEAGG